MTISTPNSRFESVNQMIQEMNEVPESITLRMMIAQDKTKYYADKKRNFLKFEVDDKIYLEVIS